MTFTNVTGKDLNRPIEALRQLLRYLETERHPEDSQFWHSCLSTDFILSDLRVVRTQGEWQACGIGGTGQKW